MNYTVKLGWGITDDGVLKHVSEVPNGNSCGCRCIQCRGALCANNNGKKVRAYFSHQVDYNCAGESIIHFLAKVIIEEAANNNGRFLLPELKGQVESYCDLNELHSHKWAYDKKYLSNFKATQEVKVSNLVTDVLCTDNVTGELFAIEVYRTHKKDEHSIRSFRREGLMSIELDLSELQLDISRDELVAQVLMDAPRRWLHNSKEEVLKLDANNQLSKDIQECNVKSYYGYVEWLKQQDIVYLISRLHLNPLTHTEHGKDAIGNDIPYTCTQCLDITDMSDLSYSGRQGEYAMARVQVNNKCWFDIIFIIGMKADKYTIDSNHPYIVSKVTDTIGSEHSYIVPEAFQYNFEIADYNMSCEARNADKWHFKIKQKTLRYLQKKIDYINDYILAFQDKTDQSKIEELCSKLKITPPIITGKYLYASPHWNASEYVWKAFVYIYFLRKYEKIATDSIAESNWLIAMLRCPSDKTSSVKRSKDIYQWLDKCMTRKGFISCRSRLKFGINRSSVLYNNIISMDELL